MNAGLPCEYAYIERNPDGAIVSISAGHPGPVHKGHTVEQMEWYAAHALVRAEWFEDARP